MRNAPSPRLLALVLGLIAMALAIAVAAGSDLALAVPAGAAAVGLAAVFGLYTVLESRGESLGSLWVPDSRPALRILRAFAGDRLHREEVVLLLDHVERAGPNPGLNSRPRAELATIVSMSPAAFREYVTGRIEQLERES